MDPRRNSHVFVADFLCAAQHDACLQRRKIYYGNLHFFHGGFQNWSQPGDGCEHGDGSCRSLVGYDRGLDIPLFLLCGPVSQRHMAKILRIKVKYRITVKFSENNTGFLEKSTSL